MVWRMGRDGGEKGGNGGLVGGAASAFLASTCDTAKTYGTLFDACFCSSILTDLSYDGYNSISLRFDGIKWDAWWGKGENRVLIGGIRGCPSHIMGRQGPDPPAIMDGQSPPNRRTDSPHLISHVASPIPLDKDREVSASALGIAVRIPYNVGMV
jgi:hypothetical protein